MHNKARTKYDNTEQIEDVISMPIRGNETGSTNEDSENKPYIVSGSQTNLLVCRYYFLGLRQASCEQNEANIPCFVCIRKRPFSTLTLNRHNS